MAGMSSSFVELRGSAAMMGCGKILIRRAFTVFQQSSIAAQAGQRIPYICLLPARRRQSKTFARAVMPVRAQQENALSGRTPFRETSSAPLARPLLFARAFSP
jgi:hypothetical protein